MTEALGIPTGPQSNWAGAVGGPDAQSLSPCTLRRRTERDAAGLVLLEMPAPRCFGVLVLGQGRPAEIVDSLTVALPPSSLSPFLSGPCSSLSLEALPALEALL